MDRLNIFNPYRNKEDEHEDVLTRNFLVLLKNIPAVQIAFFEMIKEKVGDDIEKMSFGKLSVNEVYTQVSSGGRLKNIQDNNILSVYISDDELETKHKVEKSKRKARYDGVIMCEPSWVFIIENKPYVGNAWENQLDPNVDDANGNNIIAKPCCLSWREIIDVLSSIVNNNLSSFLEKTIIDDFLTYIDESYKWLNPYNKLGLCKRNKWLIDKRCANILKECLEREIKYHRGWKYCVDISDEDSIVREIALDCNDNEITLWMYAGEVMTSARELYKNLKIGDLEEMEKLNYVVRPNFHLSFMQSPLVWLQTNMDVKEYAEYWKNEEIKQVPSEEISDYCEVLNKKRVIKNDSELIANKITSKAYSKINVCPAILFGYKWPLDKAISLDADNKFIDECKEKINMIREAYGKKR